jgi:two-component system, cell cycle response regulator DivK
MPKHTAKKIPKKILVVEDNAENMYLVCFLLENAGYQVVKAENGLEAVQQAKAELPDLIIMDIQLPLMNGHEATIEIKKMPETRHIPVIAFTAYAMAADISRALEVGCAGYMGKPMDVETFVEELASYL